MEKKLTDEEVVKDMENYIRVGYTSTPAEVWLDLIHRLQNEVSQWKSKAEHIEEVYNADREHFIKTTTEQKAEIERLTEERDKAKRDNTSLLYNVSRVEKENAELQKRVDELLRDKGYLIADLTNARQGCKDTAKEILGEIDDSDILIVQTQEYGEIEVVPMERLKEIIKRKGVEVE